RGPAIPTACGRAITHGPVGRAGGGIGSIRATSAGPELVQLIRQSFPDRPGLNTAISTTILRRVAAGELPPTIRIHRPGDEVAFGRQDVASPGYERATRAAGEAGFDAVERLAGGRAARPSERGVARRPAV